MNKYKWLVKEPLNQKTQEQFPEISPVALQLLVDRGLDTQEKIDVVKSRLINNYGYCDICATDVLSFVASIFARGDIKQ